MLGSERGRASSPSKPSIFLWAKAVVFKLSRNLRTGGKCLQGRGLRMGDDHSTAAITAPQAFRKSKPVTIGCKVDASQTLAAPAMRLPAFRTCYSGQEPCGGVCDRPVACTVTLPCMVLNATGCLQHRNHSGTNGTPLVGHSRGK